MNRKTTILISLLAVFALAAVAVIAYFQTFKTVQFDIQKPSLALEVKQDNAVVGNLAQTGELQLQDGKYQAVPKGDAYDTTPIAFEVKGQNMTVVINPGLSPAKLNELLQPQQAAIDKKITDTYAKIINNYTLARGQLFNEGEWYGTILIQKTRGRGDEPDIYRTVLKKEDNEWVIKAKPALILSAKDYPDIPFDILSSLNRKNRTN